MIEVGPNAYGKSAIRLVKVDRAANPHRLHDLTVAIALRGDFASSYSEGDNRAVIATDTMKNTVYALAGEHLTDSIESFARTLGRHFLDTGAEVASATVSIRQAGWRPIGAAPDAFTRDGSEIRTCVVDSRRDGERIEAGIADLVVMKTTRSAFAGFPRDRYTTLAETDDRILATKLTASWTYAARAAVADSSAFEAIRSTLLGAFADHDSLSVQHTIWVVGAAVLHAHPEVAEIAMSLPNLHHWTVDLSPFGLANDREVYVATTEPHGLIEATIRRADLGGPGAAARGS